MQHPLEYLLEQLPKGAKVTQSPTSFDAEFDGITLACESEDEKLVRVEAVFPSACALDRYNPTTDKKTQRLLNILIATGLPETNAVNLFYRDSLEAIETAGFVQGTYGEVITVFEEIEEGTVRLICRYLGFRGPDQTSF